MYQTTSTRRDFIGGAVASLALPFISRAEATVNSHQKGLKRGRSQLNLNFALGDGSFPFINHVKCAQQWSDQVTNGGVPPSNLNANGYPTTIGNGIYTIFGIPYGQRPGKWCLAWEGAGTLGCTGLGFKTATDGNFTFDPGSGRIDLRVNSAGISNIRFFNENDRNMLEAGQIFSTQFVDTLLAGGWGVLRFLDWQYGNTTNVRLWADRKPLDYVYWVGQEIRADCYAGISGGSSSAYTASAPPGWGGLVDKAIATINWNETASTSEPTLNVAETGAKVIRGPYGRILDFFGQTVERPTAGRYSTLIYDQDLDCWLKFGGDALNFDQYLNNGMPIEVMLALAEEIGAHPWFVPPFLSCDPITDWMAGLATHLRDHAPSWMVPRFEATPNETWNGSAGFYATPYGQLKAESHWGIETDPVRINNWAGKVASTNGQAISAVYSNDRNKYWCVLGVQTGGPFQPDARLKSDEYVDRDGGAPAFDWVTHVACSNYFRDTYSDDERLAAAADFVEGDVAGKLRVASALVNSTLIDIPGDQHRFSVARFINTLLPQWIGWARGLGIEGFTFYEGGWSPDYTGNADLDALYRASRMVKELKDITFHLYNAIDRQGASFPSHYYLSGSGVWALYDPNIFAVPSPQIDGIIEFNHS